MDKYTKESSDWRQEDKYQARMKLHEKIIKLRYTEKLRTCEIAEYTGKSSQYITNILTAYKKELADKKKQEGK